MAPLDPNEQRVASREGWEKAAGGWGKRADRIREWGMPVSAAMVEALALQPGMRVLELAAGPGDTGFMAAELISPGGTLISSDGAEAMLEVARERARELGVSNVEFQRLELEWIDLETASIDAVLCRWGIMLIVDPVSAVREVRRILRSGGRAAFAVWDIADRNPWATIPSRVMIAQGYVPPPDPDAPGGMFSLGDDGVLQELLEGVGFEDVIVTPVAVERRYDALERYVEETIDMSPMFSSVYAGLDADQQAEAVTAITAAAQPFVAADGSVLLPGSSLVASAGA